SDSFLFAGFLPPKSAARLKRLEALAAVPATLVFYESPQRLAAALADMAAVLGARDAAVARELTKTFEEVRRGTLSTLAEAYAGEAPPKEEIVVVIGPPGVEIMPAEDADALLRHLLREKPVSAAASEAAAVTGLPRRELYRRALALKADDPGD